MVFVPSSGDLFLIGQKTAKRQKTAPVFVPSSGDLFLMSEFDVAFNRYWLRFRPLFWGFVFNGVPQSAHPVLLGKAVCGGDGFLCS